MSLFEQRKNEDMESLEDQSPRKRQYLLDLDDPNIETHEISRDTSTSTNVFHKTEVVEEYSEDQTNFKSKFEEAQRNLLELEDELKGTRDKLNHLHGACENTEEKLAVLKDATFLYQNIVSKHEITFKTVVEENRILRVKLEQAENLQKELDEERENNRNLNDRVVVLERVKEHANEEIERLDAQQKEYEERTDAEMNSLRDRINEYEVTCTELRKQLEIKEEELINLRFQHTEQLDAVKLDLSKKHDDFVIHVEKSESLAQECEVLRQDKALGEENLLKEIESLKTKCDELDGEKGALEKEKEEIFNELSGLEARLKDLETLQAERFELKKENEDLRARIEILLIEKKKLEEEKAELEEDLGKLEERMNDLDTLQDDHDGLLVKYQELQRKYDELLAENSEFVDQVHALEQEEAKLKDEIEDWQGKYQTVSKEKNELTSRVNRLEDVESRLKKEIEELRAKLEKMREYETKYKTLLNEKESIERKLNDETRNVKDLRLKIERLQKENDELSSKDRKQRNRISELEREVKDFTREKERLTLQLKDAKSRADDSSKKVDELKARIRELENQIREKDRKIKELEKDNKKLEDELDALTETLENGKAAYMKLSEELNQVKDENERLRIELEELKSKPIVVEEAPVAASAPDMTGDIEGLQLDLEDANKERERLEEELKKMTLKYSTMYEEMTKKITILEERCETLRKESVEKELIISQLRRDENRYKERIDELEKLLEKAPEDLSEKCEELSKENDVLRKKINKLEDEVRFLSDELKNADDLSINETSELEREIKALKAKIADLEKKAKEDEREIERLRKLEKRKGDDDWKNQYNSLKIKFDSLERERDMVKREKDRLHKDCVDGDDELQNVRARLSKMKKQNDELNIEINTLRIQIREYERNSRSETSKLEIAELKKKLKDREEELEMLRNELNGIDGEEWPQRYESLKLKYEELEDEKNSLYKEKSELQRELRISAEKVAELEIKISHSTSDEKRLREEIRIYKVKITELEVRIEKARKGDKEEIDKLKRRIVELEEEIIRLKKLLMEASDDGKARDKLQAEIEDLEKEVIILTHEIELKTTKNEDQSKEIEELLLRIKELENQPIPEPQKIQVTETVLEENVPDGVSPWILPPEPTPNETSTLTIDVIYFPEIVLGVLVRSTQRSGTRFQGKGRALSQFEFQVEALPGTVLVGVPLAVKVDASQTPTLQHPDLIDGTLGEDHISPDMDVFVQSAPETFQYEQERNRSPVAVTLEANEVQAAYPQMPQILNTLEPRSGAFRPVSPKGMERSPREVDQDAMSVPRGKLVPVRAVIRDSTAVVQRAEPTMIAPDDSVFDDRTFKPVEVGRSKSFSGDRTSHPEEPNGYPNGYHDDFIYPRELQQRYQEEREVRAVKPSEFKPEIPLGFQQDDGVKRGTTWKPVEEMTPMERQRRSVGSLDRFSSDERISRDQQPFRNDDRRQVDNRRRMEDEARLRQRQDEERAAMRRNKQERRSFDERKMRGNRRDMERGGDNRHTMDERDMRRNYQEEKERNFGWDKRLMEEIPKRETKPQPDVKLWL